MRIVVVIYIFPALTFSSGLATTMSITQALMSAGDHVVLCEDCYGGTGRYYRTLASKMGIETTLVDGTNVKCIMDGIKPGKTKIVWLETPTNPCLNLTDIKAVSEELKKSHPDIIFVLDNTFMSSYLQVSTRIKDVLLTLCRLNRNHWIWGQTFQCIH